MKFRCLNSTQEVNVNTMPYLIDWDRVVSKPQKKVKDFLRPYWQGHVVLEEFRIPRTRMRVDLLSLTSHVAVEVSPAGSHSFNEFFHKNRQNFRVAVGREFDKAAWLEQNGFTLVEVFDDDMDKLSRKWFRETYNLEL